MFYEYSNLTETMKIKIAIIGGVIEGLFGNWEGKK